MKIAKRPPKPFRLRGIVHTICGLAAMSAASSWAAEPKSMDDLFGLPPAKSSKSKPKAPTAPDATRPSVEPVVDAAKPVIPAASPAPATSPAQPASPAIPPAAEIPATPATSTTIQPVAAPISAARTDHKPASGVLFSGFYQNDLAYTYAGKKHWSRFSNTLDVAATAENRAGFSWKLGARAVYDPIYDWTDYYNRQVRNDQRLDADIREAYVDFSRGDWDFRLGRQHIVWGEMVSLFFADVVSAKDLRQSVLPDFDMIRIPQWAARAEYFKDDFHAEAVWIPYMTYDNIGKPGAEFYPFAPPAIPGVTTRILAEKQPHGAGDGAWGLRLSYLQNGWDLAGFFYDAPDTSAAFRRLTPLPAPHIEYRPIHPRIRQVGATLAKDFRAVVFKAEAVHTAGKLFNTLSPADADGLVEQDMLDVIAGLEWSLAGDTRLNLQLFNRWFPDHDRGIIPDRNESGFSLLLSTQALHPKIAPELLLVRSLNRDDWLAQFRLTWKATGNWRVAAGVDVFEGPRNGLFGSFDQRDRIYTEVRYHF